MTKTYLLIDLQNRKPAPADIASWMGVNGEAWIFFGEQEIGLLAQYMELGDRVSLVDISKPGKNSLDFHLVLYLGYLVGRHEPGARFVIVAADGDYDPAIVHARSKGRQVERVEVLGPAPDKAAVIVASAPRSKKSKSVDQISSEIRKDLVEAGKPKTLDALKRRIQWRFGPEPVPEKVDDVMARLVTSRVIEIADGSLRYMDRIGS